MKFQRFKFSLKWRNKVGQKNFAENSVSELCDVTDPEFFKRPTFSPLLEKLKFYFWFFLLKFLKNNLHDLATEKEVLESQFMTLTNDTGCIGAGRGKGSKNCCRKMISDGCILKEDCQKKFPN